MARYRVSAIAVHVVHPVELTAEFTRSIRRIQRLSPQTMLLAQLPLLNDVNNNVEVLRELFVSLYGMGIKPYYLFHCMPNIPGAAFQRTPVAEGVRLMRQLEQHIQGPALPKYVIPHKSGKRIVPQNEAGDSEFVYTRNTAGNPIIRFIDWKGNWQEYPDG